MSTMQRVTLSLPSDILVQARELSEGNLSQFVSHVLQEYVIREQKRVIREALIAASIANAEEALALAEEFRYVDYETTMRYVPASPELE
ncbi:MAG: type II toxin-antitoxin system CcdA family antitoxin [Roseiflexaceae bacterium]|nr:type II toxin-antitoxin system CcdA family antitoxin [Roseiflexaceae bacterium]